MTDDKTEFVSTVSLLTRYRSRSDYNLTFYNTPFSLYILYNFLPFFIYRIGEMKNYNVLKKR